MSHTTPGPWEMGEYDETGGYDCMTGGIRVGPVVLDGTDYGQRPCKPIEPEALARMMADARLIGAAHDLREALKGMLRAYARFTAGRSFPLCDEEKAAVAAIRKAEGI